jgi:hypothetical protein
VVENDSIDAAEAESLFAAERSSGQGAAAGSDGSTSSAATSGAARASPSHGGTGSSYAHPEPVMLRNSCGWVGLSVGRAE